MDNRGQSYSSFEVSRGGNEADAIGRRAEAADLNFHHRRIEDCAGAAPILIRGWGTNRLITVTPSVLCTIGMCVWPRMMNSYGSEPICGESDCPHKRNLRKVVADWHG
jgi:hypothetical protein